MHFDPIKARIDGIFCSAPIVRNNARYFSQKLYETAARDSEAAGTSASGASGAPNDDDIVDAEIVDEQ